MEESVKNKRVPTPKVYVRIFDDVRVVVEKDVLILEDCNSEGNWSFVGYFGAWESVIDRLVKERAFKRLINKKTELTFKEAKKEYLGAIQDVKNALLGEITQGINDLKERGVKT